MSDSMLVTPDFSQASGRVTDGVYKVRIKDAVIGKWEAKEDRPATRWVNWTLEIFGNSDSSLNSQHIFHRTPIEGKGVFKLQDFYRAATGEECTGPFNPSALYAQELEVTMAPQKNRPEYLEVKAVKRLVNDH